MARGKGKNSKEEAKKQTGLTVLHNDKENFHFYDRFRPTSSSKFTSLFHFSNLKKKLLTVSSFRILLLLFIILIISILQYGKQLQFSSTFPVRFFNSF